MTSSPHGSFLHPDASSSSRVEVVMGTDKKHAPAKLACPDSGTGFWHVPESGMAECVFCHHRAFSRISAHLGFWKTVHAKYCPNRANQERGRAPLAAPSL